MKFNVSTPQGKRPVEFKFATNADLRLLRNWKSKASLRSNSHVQDALEYSRLASKRWRTYFKGKRIVTSVADLRNAMAQNPRAEIVFVLVAHAPWHPSSAILGFCFCRRTWANHIIIDFAAAHPNAIRAVGGQIRGVGAWMIYSLAHLARELGITLIWGEATENSAAFYQTVLNVSNVTDHFFIFGATFEHCLLQFNSMKSAEVA
jgi:hypothetical protein